MNKLSILIGPPGSGKSTHAKTMEASGYLRISQDDQGKYAHHELFQTHVTTGRDIVVDRMNFDKAQRDKYRLEAIKNGYTVNFVEFVVPRQVCFERCVEREGHPTINGNKAWSGLSGQSYSQNTKERVEAYQQELKAEAAKSALSTYFSRYEEVTDEEGEVLRIQYNAPQKKTAIMVDLDNTLCDTSHRDHFVEAKNWGAFFKHCDKDALYPEVKRQIDMEIKMGTSIILCSGRPDGDCRDKTQGWLERNAIEYTSLEMRPTGNYKKDDITKAMLYRYEIKPYYEILYVLDDRNCVVQKWRSLGLKCWQVRNGDF